MEASAHTLDDLKAAIRGRGLRATGARIAVLRFLHDAEGPISHGEVADELELRGFDRATLFRNLNDLAAAGLVHRFDAGDHVWRFEPVRPDGHAHFVCVDCGTVQCVDGLEVRAPGGAVPAALLRGDVQLQVRGVCDDCG